METEADPHVSRNLAAQREVYGAPIGELVRELTATLSISQARLARAIGLSAPMLSLLTQGQRVKIGNPAVVQRLESVLRLAEDVRAGRIGGDAIEARLLDVASEQGVLTTEQRRSADADAAAVRRAILASGDPSALAAAAGLLAPEHPRLAALVRAVAHGDDRALRDALG
jgi:transcriptional regulator with XRE-family HTH domain